MKKLVFAFAFTLIILTVVVSITISPEVVDISQTNVESQETSLNVGNGFSMISKGENLENLTAEQFSLIHSFYRTLGNFTGDYVPEVASIAYEDGRIHFYDLVNRRTYAINNDTKGPQAYNGLVIASGNFDSDNWDEVITLNKTGFITIIDGGGTTIKQVNLKIVENIGSVIFFEVIDLDFNGYSDAVMLLETEKTFNEIFTIVNGTTGTLSVNLTLPQALDVTVGNFSANNGLEIAVAYSSNYTVTVYDYLFKPIVSGTIPYVTKIATVSNASWHYDAILALILTQPKNIAVYNATTLTSMGYSALIDFYSNLKPKSADLDSDGTNEIIVPKIDGFAIYDLNTNNITKDTVVFTDYPKYLVTSRITRDGTYDFLIGDDEVVFIFKGSESVAAEPLILRKISEPSYIQSFEVMQYDIGLPDLFVLTDFGLYVYRSDSTAPRMSNLKIYPLRPTIHDSYVSISAKIVDESTFDNPILTYNVTSVTGKILEQNEVLMVPESHMSSIYVAYLSKLKAGNYTFKITITDIYDNSVVYDNNGSMYSFNVYSELLFRTTVQKVTLATPAITSEHPMDLGKLDGDNYDDVVIGVSDHGEIIWGNNSVKIFDYWSNVSNVEVYVANLINGSNDDILVYYFNGSSSQYQVNIYNGSSLKLFRKYVFPNEVTNFAFGDVNGDRYEELVFSLDVSGTNDRLIVIDVVNNETLMEKELANIFYVGVFNLTEDRYMDVVAVTYDSLSKVLNLTAYAGEQNFNLIYFFDQSFKYDIYKVLVFLDTFVSINYKQVALIVSRPGYGYPIFLLNASNGAYLKNSSITYLAGLAMVDYNFDGIKEIAFLIYDNSLVLKSLLNDSFYFRIDSLLPEEPIATFWDNFDEDSCEDLIYVLSDGIAVYSFAANRFETIGYPFRMIHSAAIGEFFELPSRDICILTRDLIFEKYININMFYRLNITFILVNDVVLQGGATGAIVELKNVFNDPIADSNVAGILKRGSEILQSNSFTSHGNGLYTLTVSATNIPLGYYNLSVAINDDYYGLYTFTKNLTVKGEIAATLMGPEAVPQGGFVFLNVNLVDGYGHPISDATVNVTFNGKNYEPLEAFRGTYLFKISTENLSAGSYNVVVTADHELAQPVVVSSNIKLIGTPNVVIKGNGINDPIMQGKTTDILLNLYDGYNYSVSGATITAYFFGKPYTFTDLGNGTYLATISTVDVPGGKHQFLVEIHHEYLKTRIFNFSLTVLGNIDLKVSIGEIHEEKSYIVQGSPIPVWIVAVDDFGYPIENATITVSFEGKLNFTAKNIRDNIYLATLDLGKIHYGNYSIIVEASKPYHVKGHLLKSIFIYPKMPSLNISFKTFVMLLGVSFALSFLGLAIYYGASSRLRKGIETDSRGRIIMNFGLLNAAYIILTFVLFGLLGLAYGYYLKSSYELSATILSLALMELLLVFGVWLYRDIALTLISEKVSFKRFLFSFWHLISAPIVILLMFEWGKNIEWFAFYILQETMNLGVITVPSIYISLLGTYTTSIIVVALNSFLNSRQLAKRIKEMRMGGTPEKVLNEEKIDQLGKISNYIRIRFFGFLVVLGVSIVSTVPFLQYYQLGILIVLPLFFIVLIPYLASKILGVLGITRKNIEETLVSN